MGASVAERVRAGATLLDSDEEWKPMPGFPGYEISSHGRGRSYWCPRQLDGVRRQSSKSHIISTGGKRRYPQFSMTDGQGRERSVSVGVAVLTAFVGPRPDGLDCCHWDDVKTNNRLSNLRWDTKSSNVQDAIRNGIHPIGERNGLAILRDRDIPEIWKMKAQGRTGREIAKHFSVTEHTISKILTGVNWARTSRALGYLKGGRRCLQSKIA